MRPGRSSFHSQSGENGPTQGDGHTQAQGPKTTRAGSYTQGGHRRSVSSARYGNDPRASTTSYRSTRERIIVVDSQGVHREYYR